MVYISHIVMVSILLTITYNYTSFYFKVRCEEEITHRTFEKITQSFHKPLKLKNQNYFIACKSPTILKIKGSLHESKNIKRFKFKYKINPSM